MQIRIISAKIVNLWVYFAEQIDAVVECWAASNFFIFFFNNLVVWSSGQKYCPVRDTSNWVVINSSKVCKLIKGFS